MFGKVKTLFPKFLAARIPDITQNALSYIPLKFAREKTGGSHVPVQRRQTSEASGLQRLDLSSSWVTRCRLWGMSLWVTMAAPISWYQDSTCNVCSGKRRPSISSSWLLQIPLATDTSPLNYYSRVFEFCGTWGIVWQSRKQIRGEATRKGKSHSLWTKLT